MQSPLTFVHDPKATFFRDPKRLIPTLIAGVAGVFVMLGSTSRGGEVAIIALILMNWAALLVALALLIGLASVASSHIRRVINQQPEWGYSIILLLSMFIVIVVGILGVPSIVVLPASLEEAVIRNLFHAVYEPLTSSMLALLAFFSLSTIVRALQRRNREVFVIVGVALVTLIVQLPQIAALSAVTGAMEWFREYIALAGTRGLIIGTTIGTLIASMRVLLGFDQPYLDT